MPIFEKKKSFALPLNDHLKHGFIRVLALLPLVMSVKLFAGFAALLAYCATHVLVFASSDGTTTTSPLVKRVTVVCPAGQYAMTVGSTTSCFNCLPGSYSPRTFLPRVVFRFSKQSFAQILAPHLAPLLMQDTLCPVLEVLQKLRVPLVTIVARSVHPLARTAQPEVIALLRVCHTRRCVALERIPAVQRRAVRLALRGRSLL